MVPGLLNENLLTQTFPLNLIDIFIIFIITILSTWFVTKILNKEEYFEDKSVKDTYLTINFFGFFFLYFALIIFFKEIGSTTGFPFILLCEALFWYSLRYSRKKEEKFPSIKYHYNPKVSFVNTSLISIIYLLFVSIILIKSNFSINENNANIFGTLLLISVFNTLYGVHIEDNIAQYVQLNIYSYLFIVIAIILTTTSWITSSFFNLTGYFLCFYSANEISKNINGKFYISTFRLMTIILFLSGIFLSVMTSTFLPIITFSAIALLSVATLVKLKDKSYNKDTQQNLFNVIIICCFILYYLLTEEIFLVSNFFDIIEVLLA